MVKVPVGVTFAVNENKIVVSGADKDPSGGKWRLKLGKLRTADPYKAKGFQYEGEVIRRKAGKAAKTGLAAAGEPSNT